jgi:outer membrane receptor for ferrienterochelin and colicin
MKLGAPFLVLIAVAAAAIGFPAPLPPAIAYAAPPADDLFWLELAGAGSFPGADRLPAADRGDSSRAYPIDTVRVVGPRPFPEERILRPRGFVQVVPLGTESSGAGDLGSLLDRVAGVQVRRLGGLGALSLVSIRGCAPSQVEVRIDDVPLSAAQDGTSNLALLPAHLFTRVEVGRGPLSSADGGSGAGVVRLITPERFDLPLSVRVAGGSFGTRSLSAAGGLTRGPVSLLLSGGMLGSRGDYPYRDRRSTPYEPTDDRDVRRSNNAMEQQDLLLRARWVPARRSGDVAIDYLLQGLWKAAGIPGTESRQTLNVHDRFRRVLQSIGVRREGGSGPSWRLAARRQEETDHFRNPDGEIGLGRADVQTRFLAQGIDGSIGRSIPRGRTELRIDGSLSRETVEQEDFLTSVAAPEQRRDSRSLAVEAASQILGGGTDLFASQRWTVAKEPGSSDASMAAPRIGGTIMAGRGLSFRFGWGRFGRLPSFVERFGQGGVQVGNPSLRPERGTSRDVGAILRWPEADGGAFRMQVEAVRFDTRTEDAIVWIQNSQRTTRPQNLEQTKVVGTELSLRWTFHGSRVHRLLTQTATATFQNPRDVGPSATYHGRTLPYIPARKGSIETRFDLGASHLTHRLDHESSLYRDRYNSPGKRRGARTLQDLEAGYAIGRGRIEWTFAVQNVTDQQADDVAGFPLPGRSFALDVTIRPGAGERE